MFSRQNRIGRIWRRCLLATTAETNKVGPSAVAKESGPDEQSGRRDKRFGSSHHLPPAQFSGSRLLFLLIQKDQQPPLPPPLPLLLRSCSLLPLAFSSRHEQTETSAWRSDRTSDSSSRSLWGFRFGHDPPSDHAAIRVDSLLSPPLPSPPLFLLCYSCCRNDTKQPGSPGTNGPTARKNRRAAMKCRRNEMAVATMLMLMMRNFGWQAATVRADTNRTRRRRRTAFWRRRVRRTDGLAPATDAAACDFLRPTPEADQSGTIVSRRSPDKRDAEEL